MFQSLRYSNWKMQRKILFLVLIDFIITAVILTLFNYTLTYNNMMATSGKNMLDYGFETINRAADIMNGSVKALETLALSPTVVEAVKTANLANSGRAQADIEADIAKWDQAWKDEDDSIEGVIKKIQENEVSNFLRAFLKAMPEEAEVFVTDMQGLNVAMTDRTSDYLQSDEGWWKNAFNNGQGAIYISDAEYDESSGVWALDIGIPVRDENEQVIGILRGTIDISTIVTDLSKIKFGDSGYVTLVDKQGNILYTRNKDFLLKPVSDELLALAKKGQNGWNKNMRDVEGDPAIIAYQHPTNDSTMNLGWTLFLSQKTKELTDSIYRGILSSLAGIFVVLIFMLIVGVVIDRLYTYQG